MKAARAVPFDGGVNAVNSEVHLGQPPCGVVDLLPVDRKVQRVAAMIFDEFLGLDEHATRAAAGVIDAALIGFEHLNQRADHGAGGEELAATLAFGAGKARDEILIDAAQQVARPVGAVVHLDVGEEVNQLAQHGFVERGGGRSSLAERL